MSNNTFSNPIKFKRFVDVLQQATHSNKTFALDQVSISLDESIDLFALECRDLAKINNALCSELRQSIKRKNPFESLEQQQDFFSDNNVASGTHFIRVIFDVVQQYRDALCNIQNIAMNLNPEELYLSQHIFGNKDFKIDNLVSSFDKLQQMKFEEELNRPMVEKFVNAIIALTNLPKNLFTVQENIYKTVERYYQTLNHRHTIEGLAVHRNAILTDVALTIFNNIDAHGEIAEGKNPDELSAYSVRKAELIAEAVMRGLTYKCISQPQYFIEFIRSYLIIMWKTAETLANLFEKEIKEVQLVIGNKNNFSLNKEKDNYFLGLELFNDIDPQSIVSKEKPALLSNEERFNINFQNETLENVSNIIHNSHGTSNIKKLVEYILQRKAELRKFFQDENSFYVCKIGAGNPFSGEAPGALKVIPAERPHATLNDIVGTGTDEVKAFLQTIKSASKWHDLFVATSPSKTADKANVLLVGPPGGGKTEIMRSVASEKDSIGIFVQASDMLTCWMGEAQKNPKRLFEEGLKLKKESNKHIHFLIDEIDAVLNNDKDIGKSANLTLEFQVLMDGVVHYPGLSVWGTTNSPRRIPMPMLRRFSSILVVGELEQKHRIQLLKQFMDCLPYKNFTDEVWEGAAKSLEGATGDVIRKVVDTIWRTSVTEFVQTHPSKAEEALKKLNDGTKFDIRNFSSEKRLEFKNELSKYFYIKPEILFKTISIHLDNIAVAKEIETAVETYKSAKEFLFQLDSGSR